MNKFKNPFECWQKGAVEVLCVLLFMVVGCESRSGEDADQNEIGLKNVKLSSCDNNTKSTDANLDQYIKFSAINNNTKSTDANLDQYIKFSAINNNTLKVEHRFFMNCCCEDIKIEMNSEGNIITINIPIEEYDCNCICPKIVSFEISNLQENNTYEFIFLRNTQVFHTCELLFTNQVDCEIQL